MFPHGIVTCAIPNACDAIPILPASNVIIAILKPKPGSPKIFSLGISQSSKISEHVDDPLIPSLSSFLPNSKPLMGLGTMNAEIPLCLRLLSVVAKTTDALLSKPLVIQHFVPLRIHLSTASFAVVDAAPASDPFPGSDKAKQPTISPVNNI